MADRLKSQEKYKRHLAYGKEFPRETYAAIQALRPWERDEATLVHAVAMAINEAHQLGKKGKDLPAPNYENLDENDVDTGGTSSSPRTRAAVRPAADLPVQARPARTARTPREPVRSVVRTAATPARVVRSRS